MGLYHLDLDALETYTGQPISELKQKSYAELEHMILKMNEDKIMQENKRNAQDLKYEHLVLTYFTPLKYLTQWFSEKEIVLACANCHITELDLCQELRIEPGKKPYRENAEYLRTSHEYMPAYDRWGRELAEKEYRKVDVYRVASQYQGNRHGSVVLYLLYQKYPQLQQFQFSAYSMDYGIKDYEIYSKDHVYTPFAALMSGDVDAIIKRNEDYCKAYNHGKCSPEGWKETMTVPDVQQMFEVIRGIRRRLNYASENNTTNDGVTENNTSDSEAVKNSKTAAKSGVKKLLWYTEEFSDDKSMQDKFAIMYERDSKPIYRMYDRDKLPKKYLPIIEHKQPDDEKNGIKTWYM